MATRPSRPETSPFFQTTHHTPPSKKISNFPTSEFFLNSPTSALRSLSSLKNGSLLGSLVPPTESVESLSTGDLHKAAYQQFCHCGTFVCRYQEMRGPADVAGTQVSVADQILESVRHLCPFACYLRAFAPFRKWHELRSETHEILREEMRPDVLSGWSCHLLAPDETQTSLPRVVFVSPEGKVFKSKAAVLREITKGEAKEDGGSHVLRKRKRKGGARVNLFGTKSVAVPSLENPFSGPRSPFGLLEELFVCDPWLLLLSAILLNRTRRAQVDVVLYRFLQRWPSCNLAASADTDEVSRLLAPLGMHRRRAKTIVQFSKEYQELLERKSTKHEASRLTEDEVLGLPGCGTYALDAFCIFVNGKAVYSKDLALQAYVDYQRQKKRNNGSHRRK